jgi:predicted ribosomally synthesized peptide with SipW-like signal peptide
MQKRRLILLAGALTALAVAVGAYAYWTQSGTGSGTATAGTTSAITVNQTSSNTGLYPGGTASTLSGNFDNPNSSAVQISSITAVVSSVSNGTTDGSKPNCTASDFAIGGSVGVTTVPSGTGVGSWSGLTIRLVNGVANQDNCKGATANITYTANP